MIRLLVILPWPLRSTVLEWDVNININTYTGNACAGLRKTIINHQRLRRKFWDPGWGYG